MKQNFTSFLFLLGIVFQLQAQSYSAKIVDKQTKEPIPFATIQFSKEGGAITNEEGVFKFEKTKNQVLKDSIEISYLGYITKKIAIQKNFPELIYLEEDAYELDPVFLLNKNITAIEIIKKVQQNISKNYQNNPIKTEVFIRETYKQTMDMATIRVKKSSVKNINQALIDGFMEGIPRKFTALVESYGNAYVNTTEKSKISLQKMMIVQNKQEKDWAKKIQADFMNMLKNNTKPNSYLIIKSGVIRLDKTESIDSIIAESQKYKKRDTATIRKDSQKYRTTFLNNIMKDLFINKDAEVDFLQKLNRYEFTKEGYVEIGENLAYVIDFKPKRGAAYKGKLYIDTEDFGVIKADIQSAQKKYKSHFNMLGIKANDLSFRNIIIFEKNTKNKYQVKYLKTHLVNEGGVNRPFKIIEKNKFVKGRKKQNQVVMQLVFYGRNTDTKEMVFNNSEGISKSTLDSYKPKAVVEIERFNQYNKQFWNGYTIITPEKAIAELKIEE